MPAALLPAVVAAALKGAVLLVIVALAMPFLRRRSAAVRHGAWSFAVGAQLVLPALAVVAPSWGAPLVEPPAWVTDVLPRHPGGARAETGSAATDPGAVVPAVPGPGVGGVREGAVVQAARGEEDRTDGLPGTLAAVWLAGAGLILLRLAVGTIGVWRLAVRSRLSSAAGESAHSPPSAC